MATVTTQGGWGFSTTSGHGIPAGMCQVSVYKVQQAPYGKPFGIRYGQLNGLVTTDAEATRLGLEYGYLHHFGRNTCGWVMSRAARRRGYCTTDWRYTSRVSRALSQGRFAKAY